MQYDHLLKPKLDKNKKRSQVLGRTSAVGPEFIFGLRISTGTTYIWKSEWC